MQDPVEEAVEAQSVLRRGVFACLGHPARASSCRATRAAPAAEVLRGQAAPLRFSARQAHSNKRGDLGAPSRFATAMASSNAASASTSLPSPASVRARRECAWTSAAWSMLPPLTPSSFACFVSGSVLPIAAAPTSAIRVVVGGSLQAVHVSSSSIIIIVRRRRCPYLSTARPDPLYILDLNSGDWCARVVCGCHLAV